MTFVSPSASARSTIPELHKLLACMGMSVGTAFTGETMATGALPVELANRLVSRICFGCLLRTWRVQVDTALICCILAVAVLVWSGLGIAWVNTGLDEGCIDVSVDTLDCRALTGLV